MSWAVEVVADSTGKFTGNALRFEHSEEALQYGKDLAWRWTSVREMRVVQSTEEVNYKWSDGRLEKIERASMPVCKDNEP